MRRTHDYFGATNRGGNVPAFSTPSPGEELLKRLRLLPERLGLPAPTLFVCLSSPQHSFTTPPSLSTEVHPRSHHLFRLASPSLPRAFLGDRPPTQREKHDSNPIGSRRGFLQTAVSKARRPGPRGTIAFSSARFRYSTNVFGPPCRALNDMGFSQQLSRDLGWIDNLQEADVSGPIPCCPQLCLQQQCIKLCGQVLARWELSFIESPQKRGSP
jgi:hypothetical protein